MNCESCGGDTRVVDSRGRKHSKAELQVRLKLPFLFESKTPYRWRKRKCGNCRKVSYSVEVGIDELKGLVLQKKDLK